MTVSRGRACAACGCAFTVAYEHPQQRYCSRSCAGRGRKRLAWLVCERDGCDVRFPQRKTGQRYCSVECGRSKVRRAVA